MRFRPRKLLLCLLAGISVVVILANFLSYNYSPLVEERYPNYDDAPPPPQEERIPNHISFEERLRKYDLNNITQHIRVFQTWGFQILSTVLPKEGTVIPNHTAKVLPPRNWSENEWYREQFVRRIWRNSENIGSSLWVAKTDKSLGVLDDRILEQMRFVPNSYRNRMRRGSKDVGGETEVAYKMIYVPSGVDAETPLGTLKFLKDKCPVSACNITTDVLYENTAHLRLLQADAYFSSFEKKPSGQIWAIWILESPANTVDFDGPADLINWTATYRWDSTIVTPYAKFVPLDSVAGNRENAIQERNYAVNKTKMVAWFVSNCNAKNKRWEFAQELNKYIPVEIFGACGSLECPRSDQSSCNDRLNSDYKFYLSFENSDCDHYITEKFFENGLGNDVVPIVMGARKEDYRKASPPNSYIHVDDFRSAKDLADYLMKLNASDHLYNEYFRWKSSGEFINTKFWCRICALLHDDDRRPDMWYTDFHNWWMHDEACRSEELSKF